MKFMSKERYNQIVDEVYKNFKNNFPIKKSNPPKDYINDNGQLLIQEEFIDKIKTDEEFSEKWGLKIEERKLNQSELNILYNKRRGVGEVDTKYTVGTIIGKDPLVPRKLITVTYNNETIEVYE